MRRPKSDIQRRRSGQHPAGLCFLSALALFLLASQVRAQGTTDVVRLREAISVDNVRQGSTFEAAVILDIKYELGDRHEIIATYHINSAKPSDPKLIPTTLQLEEIKGFTFSPVRYPKGIDVRLQFSNQPLSVYSAIGKPTILFSVRVAPDIPLGLYDIRGKLTYQPCSDKGCDSMKSIEIKIPVFVVDSKTKVRRINKYYFGVTARDYLLVPVRLVEGKWILAH